MTTWSASTGGSPTPITRRSGSRWPWPVRSTGRTAWRRSASPIPGGRPTWSRCLRTARRATRRPTPAPTGSLRPSLAASPCTRPHSWTSSPPPAPDRPGADLGAGLAYAPALSGLRRGRVPGLRSGDRSASYALPAGRTGCHDLGQRRPGRDPGPEPAAWSTDQGRLRPPGLGRDAEPARGLHRSTSLARFRRSSCGRSSTRSASGRNTSASASAKVRSRSIARIVVCLARRLPKGA